MKEPHIDDFESMEDYEDAESRYEAYVDHKIAEKKEERHGLNLINENTVNELKQLNDEIEKDLNNE